MQPSRRVEHLGGMKPLLAWLFSSAALGGHAQGPAPAVRADSALHLNVVPNGRYASAFYTVHQEPQTMATVKRLLKRYPPAAAELRKGRAQTRWGLLVLLPVAEAALLVGGTQANRRKDAGGSAFSRSPVPFPICLGAFFGGLYLGASNTHFDQAIEAYNQQFH